MLSRVAGHPLLGQLPHHGAEVGLSLEADSREVGEDDVARLDAHTVREAAEGLEEVGIALVATEAEPPWWASSRVQASPGVRTARTRMTRIERIETDRSVPAERSLDRNSNDFAGVDGEKGVREYESRPKEE